MTSTGSELDSQLEKYRYHLILELRSGKASELQGTWTTFQCELVEQSLYLYPYSSTLTGHGPNKREFGSDVAVATIYIAGSHSERLAPAAVGAQRFTFVLKLPEQQHDGDQNRRKSLWRKKSQQHNQAHRQPEAYIFSASTDSIREHALAMLNYAAVDPDWVNPFYIDPEYAALDARLRAETVGSIGGAVGSSLQLTLLPNSSIHTLSVLHSAACRIQSIARVIVARRRILHRLRGGPQLLLVSVNNIADVICTDGGSGESHYHSQVQSTSSSSHNDDLNSSSRNSRINNNNNNGPAGNKKGSLFAYVSGLVVHDGYANLTADQQQQPLPPQQQQQQQPLPPQQQQQQQQQLSQQQQQPLSQHRTSHPVCIARTPAIDSFKGYHVALLAHDAQLSFISVSLVDTKWMGKAHQEPVGIVFLPVNEIPAPTDANPTYTVTLPLEPYLVPDLDFYQTNDQLAQRQDFGLRNNTIAPVQRMSIGSDCSASSAGSGHTARSDFSFLSNTREGEYLRNGMATVLSGGNQSAKLNHSVSGTVTVTVAVPDKSFTMCGWIYKKSDRFLSKAWKKYWFVLLNGELQYYESFNTRTALVALDQPKKVIPCETITHLNILTARNSGLASHSLELSEAPAERTHAVQPSQHDNTASANSFNNDDRIITLSFKMRGRKCKWVLNIDAAADYRGVGDMWLRKLFRCCPKLRNPDIDAAQSAGFDVIEMALPQTQLSQRAARSSNQQRGRALPLAPVYSTSNLNTDNAIEYGDTEEAAAAEEALKSDNRRRSTGGVHSMPRQFENMYVSHRMPPKNSSLTISERFQLPFK